MVPPGDCTRLPGRLPHHQSLCAVGRETKVHSAHLHCARQEWLQKLGLSVVQREEDFLPPDCRSQHQEDYILIQAAARFLRVADRGVCIPQ